MSSRKLHDQPIYKTRDIEKTMFPPGFNFTLNFNNPDEMSEYGIKWKQEYFQISRGNFKGSINAAHTANIQIIKVIWSPGIFVAGDIPEGSIVFGVSLTGSNQPVFHSDYLQANEVAVLQQGDEIDFMSKYPHEMLVVTVDKNIFNRFSTNLLGKESDSINYSNYKLNLKGKSYRQELVNRWSDMLNLALTSNENLIDANFANTFEEELISSVLTSSGASENYVTRIERHRAAIKAREFILENNDKLLTIFDICEVAGTTERTLHLGFKELYGVTPKAFLNCIRLNYARKELQQSNPDTTVTSIAYKWKFYHLSRFAKQYFNMFGEYPSDTLAKGNNKKNSFTKLR